MVNRILRDDPSKGDMHNRQAVDFKLLWKSMCDYDLWPLYIIGLVFQLPTGPPDNYLTLILRSIGFGTFDSNLLTIPTQVIGAITVSVTHATQYQSNQALSLTKPYQMLLLTYFSEIWNERSFMAIVGQIWVLPNLIALLALPDKASPWARFTILTVLLSFPSGEWLA